MQRLNRLAAMVAAAGLFGSIGTSSALAGTVTASFNYTNLVVANLVSPDTTGNANVATVSFGWTRSDVAGPGVDSNVPTDFASFCVEIGQHVSPHATYTYEVFTPQEAGWAASRSLGLRTLWADHFGDIVGSDTSCAFQLAVWELTYDTDRSLDAGEFRVNSPGSAKTIAQGWLSGLATSNTPVGSLPNLFVLINEGAQDQITATYSPSVPAPGPAACAMLGLVVLRGSRRRTRA